MTSAFDILVNILAPFDDEHVEVLISAYWMLIVFDVTKKARCLLGCN